MSSSLSPPVPSSRELSLRAVLLGIVLSFVLSSANAYLGLFAGMTVSASIPAAVLSMGMFKAFRGGILENNLVQTAASAGESAAAGAIFTLPALVLLGSWRSFDLPTCAVLVFIGGTLGVLFTTFLRKPLIEESSLPYPEGVATAEVLEAGHGGSGVQHQGAGMRLLVGGAFLGAAFKFVESGLGWSRAVVEGATRVSGATFYWGSGTAPALLAVGHIVGLRTALLIFGGGVLNWVCVLPFVVDAPADQSALQSVWEAWSHKTRYLGVGAMTVGGLGALLSVRQSVGQAVVSAWQALGASRKGNGPVTRDLPPTFVLGTIALSVVPLTYLFGNMIGSFAQGGVLAVLVLVVGFLFSSVAAYMAGLVGSSNNPVSGVTIATVVFASLLLSAWGVEASGSGVIGAAGPAAAILVGTIVCTAAAIGGDNLQDLKAGHLLGADPGKQQVMQLIGVAAASLVLGPVLQVLLDAYGFGASSAEHPLSLRAPQAALMASVADGVFGGHLPWNYVYWGAGIGAAIVVLDEVQKARRSSLRFPPLAVALGLYLPCEMSGPILLGAWLGSRGPASRKGGLLAAAGLITGEALLGIVLAVGVATTGSQLSLGGTERLESAGLSLLVVVICLGFLRHASGRGAPGSSSRPPGAGH